MLFFVFIFVSGNTEEVEKEEEEEEEEEEERAIFDTYLFGLLGILSLIGLFGSLLFQYLLDKSTPKEKKFFSSIYYTFK